MVSVLIVTCPCALSLAAPSALLAAAGALVRRGVLVQRFDALEALAALDTLAFDKTGTLTESGRRCCTSSSQPAARDAGLDEPRCAPWPARSRSPRPIRWRRRSPRTRGWCLADASLRASRRAPGLGVEAIGADGRRYRLGAAAWATRGATSASAGAGPEIWLAGPDGALARFAFAEVLRADAARHA